MFFIIISNELWYKKHISFTYWKGARQVSELSSFNFAVKVNHESVLRLHYSTNDISSLRFITITLIIQHCASFYLLDLKKTNPLMFKIGAVLWVLRDEQIVFIHYERQVFVVALVIVSMIIVASLTSLMWAFCINWDRGQSNLVEKWDKLKRNSCYEVKLIPLCTHYLSL